MYDDLILLMKTLTNFLHKCSKLEDISVSSLLWPPALQELLVAERVVWIDTKLNSIWIKAENTLFSGQFVSINTVNFNMTFACTSMCC